MPNDEFQDPQDPTQSFSPNGAVAPGIEQEPEEPSPDDVDLQGEQPQITDEIKDLDVSTFDIAIKFSEKEEEELVAYLEDNLPKMKPSDDERKRILSYIAMYEGAVRQRVFPYEGAPFLPSTDALDTINEWLDIAETAFFSQRVTFTIDRDDTSFSEETIRRLEKTFQTKFFLKNFANDFPAILFDSAFLGGSILSLKEEYDVRSVREKVVIRDDKDLAKYVDVLNDKQKQACQAKLSTGDIYVTEREYNKIVHIGPRLKRVDRTKFWYPQATKTAEEWQIVAEEEYYTKSQMLEMAEKGEFDKQAVNEAIETRKTLYGNQISNADKRESEKQRLPEDIKYNKDLDADWGSEIEKIKQWGDAYEDQFVTYRVTLYYNAPSKSDSAKKLRTWIQVMYCPAASNILGANYCQDGFSYFPIQYRKVSYKTFGPGIAQQRYYHNYLDTELKSMFLASLEQEIGAPLLIKDGSGLYASAFRAFPGSVSYTRDPASDARFLPFPDKSRLAVEGMSTVLGSSPKSNLGAGYASGRRAMLDYQQKQQQIRARIFSIATDLDEAVNAAWKVYCRLSKFNTPTESIIDWVLQEEPPKGNKLYVLEEEMDPNVFWTSTLTSVTLTPDIRLQEAMQRFDFFYKNVPVAVNNPRLSIAWYNYMAQFFTDMDEMNRQKLLPQESDFQQYFQQLGQQGAQAGGAPQTPGQPSGPAKPAGQGASVQVPGGPGGMETMGPVQAARPLPSKQGPQVPPLVAQSPSTPFRNPLAMR